MRDLHPYYIICGELGFFFNPFDTEFGILSFLWHYMQCEALGGPDDTDVVFVVFAVSSGLDVDARQIAHGA